ncbi:hypothetical protein EZV62_012854 [Acer yangbiense]|uniref:Tubulin-folding cofactor C n=1 Tax=Acer yangbiense TaxID=1000413 RepID=A0A5C7HWI7_9ROSI|nr:hypothetical protein EZV62_012854 [Acer yangbiense]
MEDEEQTLQKKHQLMLERLSAHHQTRLETHPPNPFDSSTTSAFLSRFNDSKKSIATQIESSADPSRLPDISTAISDLEKFVAKNFYLLPSYEIRSSLKTISDLKQSSVMGSILMELIIEDSDGVRFANYCLKYEGIEEDLAVAVLDEETGNWANMDDFKWLRAMQSPNWSILHEDVDLVNSNSSTS